jgi:hypothetical protein
MKELSMTPAAVRQREYRKINWDKIREIEKRSYEANKPKRKIYDKSRRSKNPEFFRNQIKEWRLKNPEKVKSNFKEWSDKNKLHRVKYTLEWRTKNPDKAKAISRRAYLKNKEKILARNEEWRAKNREVWLVKGRAYYQRIKERRNERRRNSPIEKTIGNCRCRINDILRMANVKKSDKTEEIIGCSADFMRQFIEHQFKPEMNWLNWGTYWELDHVIPISKFDVSDPVQLRRAFNYSNCKPITKVENRSKSDKLPPPHQALLI